VPEFKVHVTPLPVLPDLLGLHAADAARFPFLLDSAATGGSMRRTLGQYDILFCEPGAALELAPADAHAGSDDFFTRLDRLAPTRHGPSDEPDALPFRGGWFVFMAYELAMQVEPILSLPVDDALPLALAVRIESAVVICRRTQRAWLVSERADTRDLIDTITGLRTAAPREHGQSLIRDLLEEPAERYLDAVSQAKEHIAAGDVFQANLSRLWRAHLAPGVDDIDVYRRLRSSNPAPFAGLMAWRERRVLSSSPERLVRLGRGTAQTRPIAGTRPRGVGASADRARSTELIGHPKERAEHVMLIDLERNDLGRVCRAGTVEVDEFMAIETYAHVHHIVSNVRGVLEEGVGPGAALRAVYPGGTITGCPKVRCMQIIAQLEGTARGAYTGAMGYLNRDGSGDFNILIRTAVSDGDEVTFRAGAGIVADSEPQAELQETRAKARGLVLALTGDTRPSGDQRMDS